MLADERSDPTSRITVDVASSLHGIVERPVTWAPHLDGLRVPTGAIEIATGKIEDERDERTVAIERAPDLRNTIGGERELRQHAPRPCAHRQDDGLGEHDASAGVHAERTVRPLDAGRTRICQHETPVDAAEATLRSNARLDRQDTAAGVPKRVDVSLGRAEAQFRGLTNAELVESGGCADLGFTDPQLARPPNQVLARTSLEIVPAGHGCESESPAVRRSMSGAKESGLAVRAPAVVTDCETLDPDDPAASLGERTKSRRTDPSEPNDDNIRSQWVRHSSFSLVAACPCLLVQTKGSE